MIKIENVHQHCSKKLFKIYPLIIAATLENAAQNIYYALLRISYLEICPQPAHSILSKYKNFFKTYHLLFGPNDADWRAIMSLPEGFFALLTHRSMHWTRHTPPPPPQGLGPYLVPISSKFGSQGGNSLNKTKIHRKI